MSYQPELPFVSRQLESELMLAGVKREFPSGATLVSPGDEMSHMFFLLAGTVKLYRVFESGDRHLLYLMNGACACAYSIISTLLSKESTVEAVTESHVQVLLVPRAAGEELLETNAEWRTLVMGEVLHAWQDSLMMLDQVAFKSLEKRLENYLSNHERLNDRGLVYKSHAEIATDLNVSREAVSRCLKRMENAQKLHLGHGSIKVLNLNL